MAKHLNNASPKYDSRANLFDYLKSFGRTKIGTPIYNTISFKEAFRDSRINGDTQFIWNNNRYNNNLQVDEFVESVRSKKPTSLKEAGARKLMIRNPNKYRNLSDYEKKQILSKDEYYRLLPDNINYDDVNAAVNILKKEGFSRNQILAMLGNSFVESDGWRTVNQVKGNAKGYYQMEPPMRKRYENYLTKNELKDNFANETKFIANLFKTKDKILITPTDVYNTNLTNKKQEAKQKGEQFDLDAFNNNYKTAYKLSNDDYYKGVTTEQAFSDWEHGDIDATSTAFTRLYEKPGIPHADRRLFITNLLNEDENINFKFGGIHSLETSRPRAKSGIHIKPENRGKFTATMERTGKTAEELSHSSNPLTRKRAIFALNARKWNH